MPSRPRLADWLSLVALTVMWGSAFALTRAAVEQLSPAWVVQGRLLIGAVLLLLLWGFGRRIWPRGSRLWAFLLAIAVLGNVVPFNLIAWGQQTIDSGLAGILMAVMPLFTLVIAHFTVPGERLSVTRLAGFAFGLVGVVVLMAPDIGLVGQVDTQFLLAALAVLGGAFCYAVSAVLSRLRPKSDVISSATATTVIAAVAMAMVLRPSAIEHEALAAASNDALVAIVLLGVFSTAIAAVVYFHLIERTGPGFVSQLNYLIPVWAVVLGAAMFGERPALTDYLAMLIILAGIAVSQLGSSKRSPSAVEGRVVPEQTKV